MRLFTITGIRKIFLVTGVLLMALLPTRDAKAQNAKEDFTAINKAYQRTGKFSAKVKYLLYPNEKSTVPFQQEEGEIKYNGSLAYTKTGPVETIKNKEYSLLVDHEQKEIALIKSLQGPAAGEDKGVFAIDLEKALSMCEKVEFKSLPGKLKSYILSFPSQSEYSKAVVVFNSSYIIEKMVLYYRKAENLEGNENGPKEQPRLEIIYKETNTDPVYDPKDFTYEKFLHVKNGKYYNNEAYKNYHLIN